MQYLLGFTSAARQGLHNHI